MSPTKEHLIALRKRRSELRSQLGHCQALFPSGSALGRNYAGNPFPFRASSHFLFLVGQSIEDAFFLSCPNGDTLFVEPQGSDDVLWHGKRASLSELSNLLELTVQPLNKLTNRIQDSCLTLAANHLETRALQASYLNRPISGHDTGLAKAMTAIRLSHDEHAIARLTETAQLAAKAHADVPRFIEPGMTEHQVWAQMQAAFTSEGYGYAYNPIITTHGEILHGGVSNRRLAEGDLLLLDVGCEHPEGWAADITRTWPVSGTLSTTQAVIHEAVCAAQDVAIETCTVGAEYLDVHLAAAHSLTESLLQIGILRGTLDELFEKEAFAYFFPHGIGHLLGLDVHDMEDLGDIAGYADGRSRVDTPGQRYLRLNRPLQPGMLVTIEPGFYQIPAILGHARQKDPQLINWNTLTSFSDVRGIRIEDDVLIQSSGPLILSADAPRTLSSL